MSAFPAFHYPDVIPPRQQGVELPDAFGCFHSCSASDACGSKIHFQYGNKDPGHLRLDPEGHNTPFLPPNEGPTLPAMSYPDFIRKAHTTHTLVTNVEEQVEYCYTAAPETCNTLLDFLSHKEVSVAALEGMSKALVKRVGKTMPEILDGITSCGVPRTLLSHMLNEELNSQVETMYHNDALYGGCLSYATLSSMTAEPGDPCGLLFYPSGELLDRVNAHVLDLGTLEGGVSAPKTSPLVHQKEVGGCVRQVESYQDPHRSGILAGVRTDYRCFILEYELNSGVKHNLLSDLHSQHRIKSLAVSPFIYGEFIFSDERGQVHLCHHQSSGAQTYRPSGEPRPVFGHYTAHPRILFMHTREQAYQLDFRISSSSPSKSHLLSLPSSCLPSDQYFCVARQHTSNPFYHCLATQHYLTLVDERFPGHVVLQWPHLLSSPPICLDISRGSSMTSPSSSAQTSFSSSSSSSESFGSSEDFVFLSSQLSRETHCFQFSCSASQAPVTRKGPWKIEDNDRWVDLLPSVPSRGYDGVRSRLKSPLVGMCAGKLATEHSNSITVFQMSQVGDVHHQVFSIEDKSDCEGCPRSAVLPSRVERQCMDFVEKVLKSRDSFTEARPLLLGKALKRKTTKAVMEAMKCSQEKGCHLCRHDNHMEEDAETVRLDACLPCLGCGLSAEEASTLLSAATHPNTVLTAAQLQGNVKSPKVPKLMASYKIRGLLGHRLWDHWEHGWSKVCGRYPFCLSSLAAIGVQKMELPESPSKSAKKTPSIKRRTAVTPSNTSSRKKVIPPQQPEDEGLESTALPTKGVSQVGMPTLVLKKVPLPPDGLGQVWSGCSPRMLPGQGTPDSQSRNGVRSQSAIRSMSSVSTKTPRNFHSLKRRSNQIGF